MDIRFGDHPAFHRAALGMMGASAALGLALHALESGPLAAIAAGLGGIAIGTAIGYGKAPLRIVFALVACVPGFLMTRSTAALALTAAAMGITIAAYGLRGVRGVLAVVLGA